MQKNHSPHSKEQNMRTGLLSPSSDYTALPMSNSSSSNNNWRGGSSSTALPMNNSSSNNNNWRGGSSSPPLLPDGLGLPKAPQNLPPIDEGFEQDPYTLPFERGVVEVRQGAATMDLSSLQTPMTSGQLLR